MSDTDLIGRIALRIAAFKDDSTDSILLTKLIAFISSEDEGQPTDDDFAIAIHFFRMTAEAALLAVKEELTP